MNRQETINRLSFELAERLGMKFNIPLIKEYIQAAVVSEMERSSWDVQIYQRIDMKTGVVLDEYWGIKAAHEYVGGDIDTVRRQIYRAISGERGSAYGFLWKKV